MPRGVAGIKRAAAKREGSGGDYQQFLWFKLQEDGDTAIVRFADEPEDLAYAETHQIPTDKMRWGINVPCLNQDSDSDEDCPGCDSANDDIARLRFKGYPLIIWRDAPLYKKDDEGRNIKDRNDNYVQIGNEDQIAVWSAGITLFTELVEDIEEEYGLTSRDFKIKRKGTGKKTKYILRPVEGSEGKLSTADRKLIDQCEYDLDSYTKPDRERLERALGITSSSGSSNGNATEQAKKVNPFKRRAK